MPEYNFDGYVGTHTYTCNEMYSETPDDNDLQYMMTSVYPELPADVAALIGTPPQGTYFYHSDGGWEEYVSLCGESIKTITFTSEQQVSDEFYNWFIANATQK